MGWTKKQLGRILWVIIGVSLGLHVIFMILDQLVLGDFKFPHEPAHASLETAGAVIALTVALWLESLEKRGRGTSFNSWIAGALVAMGLLDGFHAISHAGNSFVWLHSAATFVGGVLFMTVWIPKKIAHSMPMTWSLMVASVIIPFGLWSLYYPESTPLMVEGHQFTNSARILNMIGGAFMFISAVKLIITWRKGRNTDDLLFCLHCLLFGGAAIMFEQSQLWDFPWWGWHVLRLLAYAVAFWFVFRSQEEMLDQLMANQANTDNQDS